MKKIFLAVPLFGLLLVLTCLTLAQSPQNKQAKPTATSAPSQLAPEEIIKRFTQKESELFEAWKDYAYQQETKLQALGGANTISGEFYQVSEFIFSDAGKRIERILKAPQPTLDRAGITMTAEDRNAFINVQPFALTAEELPNYKVSFVNKEKLDDLNTFVFEVTPKILSDTREMKRMKDQKIEGKYFQGRIWVDDQDLQIVKTSGKIVPEFKQRFLKFETYRENIDGRYWFPTYTYGDDTLVFEKGDSYHMRQVIRYKNYRRFSGDVQFKVILDDVPAEGPKTKKPEDVKKEAPANPAVPTAPANKPETKAPEKKTAPTTNQHTPKKP